MTDKQENILDAALELFAQEGFNRVSTNTIAKKASVSEGLIFKHFGSKKGLLEAIVKDAEQKIQEIFAPVLSQIEPIAIIRTFIEIPFQAKEEEFAYWKLQFKLKWENDYDNPAKMQPLLDKLTWAFRELGYAKPEQEARFLNNTIEMMSIGILRDGVEYEEEDKRFLYQKYNID